MRINFYSRHISENKFLHDGGSAVKISFINDQFMDHSSSLRKQRLDLACWSCSCDLLQLQPDSAFGDFELQQGGCPPC